jgi:hypothetical protein
MIIQEPAMSDEPNWSIEPSPQGWLVVAWTLRGRTVVSGPYAKEWQANMIKGRTARDWRDEKVAEAQADRQSR